MGDARDTAKKKKADEKKSAKPAKAAAKRGAGTRRQEHGEIHEEVTVTSAVLLNPTDPVWRCSNESRDPGSGSFRIRGRNDTLVASDEAEVSRVRRPERAGPRIFGG